MAKPNKGALRVWWIPQVPGRQFLVDVASVDEAIKVLDILARYDLFQLKHRIKGDFCNAGGLECYSQDGDGNWCDWYDPESGDDIDAFRRAKEAA